MSAQAAVVAEQAVGVLQVQDLLLEVEAEPPVRGLAVLEVLAISLLAALVQQQAAVVVVLVTVGLAVMRQEPLVALVAMAAVAVVVLAHLALVAVVVLESSIFTIRKYNDYWRRK